MTDWQQSYRVRQLSSAIRRFERDLPGWWWTIGACSASRNASCGPDRNGPDAHLLAIRKFDDGFHVDLEDGTRAQALDIVRIDVLEAKWRAG